MKSKGQIEPAIDATFRHCDYPTMCTAVSRPPGNPRTVRPSRVARRSLSQLSRRLDPGRESVRHAVRHELCFPFACRFTPLCAWLGSVRWRLLSKALSGFSAPWGASFYHSNTDRRSKQSLWSALSLLTGQGYSLGRFSYMEQ